MKVNNPNITVEKLLQKLYSKSSNNIISSIDWFILRDHGWSTTIGIKDYFQQLSKPKLIELYNKLCV